MIQKRLSQRNIMKRGVSAIFIVIFAAILLSLISLSFIGLMVREQGRSVDDEQSQGAYDAALAGIEDGKRALVECEKGNSDACDAIAAKECDTVQEANIGIAPPAGVSEVAVNSGATTDINMAYTCVVVSRETPDYLGSVSSGTRGAGDAQLVIPLRPKSTDSFDRIILRWFTSSDAGGSATATLPAVPAGASLPVLTTGWPTEQPPIIRAQLIQFRDGHMSDADFDSEEHASTLYLMPSGVGLSSFDFDDDIRAIGTAAPKQVSSCSTALIYGGGKYACEAQLNLPAMTDRVAYLRLSSFYNNADVQIIMRNGLVDIDFDNVQPSIDATGRANDLFRRVETRVEFGSDFPYPRAAVDITDNFCKTFLVGKTPTDFESGGCTP